MDSFLLYGATGYTGTLIAREAVARGHRPILGGRNPIKLAALGRELGLEQRVFSLDSPAAVDQGLRGMKVVLHCAGPFVHTFRPMADGCLRNGVHYLDITGEIPVFESLAARTEEARAAGVMLLPGAGFDVVPSDCLAAHLKRRLPSATKLTLGFSLVSRLSRGTARTILENIPGGGLVRQGGLLTKVPTAWKTRRIDFGKGPIKAITIPWGDVATAYYSTGIPNIEVYGAFPWRLRIGARLSRYLGWVTALPRVRSFLQHRIAIGPPGPTDEERALGSSALWGEAEDPAGRKVVSRLWGPDGYTLTARTALAVVESVLAGEAPPGFQTPATAYGPDLILQVPGITRTDEERPENDKTP